MHTPGISLLRPSLRTGFSLVELLTVIAIIGVLGALVIVVVGRVRTSASQATCVSNLRALHAGLALYAIDHRGCYPAPTNNMMSNGARGTWSLALATDGYTNGQQIGAPGPNLFVCPEAQNTYPSGYARRTYSMNTLPATDDSVVPANLSAPSVTIILVDGVHNAEGDAIAYFQSSRLDRIDARHADGFNALFVDGHVTRLTKTTPDLVASIDNLAR